MRRRAAIIGTTFVVLSACIGIEEQQKFLPDSVHQYESPVGYHVAVPVGFTYSEQAPSGTYYYFGYPGGSSTNLQTIEFHDSLDSPCIPALTGASQTTILANSTGASETIDIPNANVKASWGRVNAWDGFQNEGWEPPFEDMHKIVCTYNGTPRPASVYALCSQKDRRTVVICINQMSDNPTLAKQIFETFRWLK